MDLYCWETLLGMALKAHLGLHSEVVLLRDVAQVPKEVVEEAVVEEASPVDRS